MTVFVIPGRAVPKARARLDRRSGRFYTPDTTSDFETVVAWEAKRAGVRLIPKGVPISLSIFEYRVRRSQKTAFPLSRPDVDNAGKAIMDALNGIAYADDSQVVIFHVEKQWGTHEHIVVDVHAIY